MKKFTGVMLAACLLSANAQAQNAEGIWTNSQGNAAHTGYMDIATQPDKFKILWTRQYSKPNDRCGKFAYEIVATDHLLYFSISDCKSSPLTQLYALHKNDGSTAWEVPAKGDYYLSGPVYENGRIYLLKHLSDTKLNTGAIESYDAETGHLQYSTIIPMRWYDTYQLPIVYKDHVYIGRYGKILSVDAPSGAIDWQVDAGDDNQSPAVTNDNVITVNDAGIDILNRISGGDKSYLSADNPEPDPYPMGAPIWDEKNKTVYAPFSKATNQPGVIPAQLTAFDLANNKVKWKIDMPGVTATALAGDKLYFSSLGDNRLYEADALTGNINWYWQSPAPLVDIVLTRDTVFGFDYADQKTFAISRTTHDKVWELNQGGIMSLDKDNLYLMNGFSTVVDVTAISLH